MQSFFPKPLSKEEEEYYIKELEKGSENAKNILIERNLRLVAHIVKKYSNYMKDTDELISIGMIGLVKAVLNFKSGKGNRLAAFASKCIENEILMSIRSNKKHLNNLYLQDTVGVDKDGNEVTLQDKVADDSMPVDEDVILHMQIKLLRETIDRVLKGREKLIIEMRYGLKTGEELTQREIAKKLNISRSYVSRIEKKALGKLLKEMQ